MLMGGGYRPNGYGLPLPPQEGSPFAMPVSLHRGIKGTASPYSCRTVNHGYPSCKRYMRSTRLVAHHHVCDRILAFIEAQAMLEIHGRPQ